MSRRGRLRVYSTEERRVRVVERTRTYRQNNRIAINESRRTDSISENQRLHNNEIRAHSRRNQQCHRLQLGSMAIVESVSYADIGDMTVKCQFCDGLSFVNEIGRSKHSCCHNGKIRIPRLLQYPRDLYELLFGSSPDSKDFRENIRVYNAAFAFASFNCVQADIHGRGPHCMRIRGAVANKVTTSLFSKTNPRYGQVYIYDDNETVKHRLNVNTKPELLLRLQNIFKCNPYAQCYRNLFDIFKSTNEETLTLNFLTYKSDDLRRYNAPTVNSIAAVIVSKDGTIPESIDIKVFPKNELESTYLQTTSHHCDPMLFPILFPKGDHGWSFLMKTALNKNVSPLQYYSFRICDRFGEFNPTLCCGRLTQHYVIHAYLTIESQRLKFLRFNQKRLRTECYHGLLDHVRNSAANNINNLRIGNVLILPSTFSGSPRSMQQLYQDAMAICRKVGRPDLFITMTCNPNWPEVKRYLRNLPPSTTATDIPHFICRLFFQKISTLIKDLESVFGGIRAYVYTIEFQKRGLPHMHLLVTLRNKLLTADDTDRFIRAEIPNKSLCPHLWYKVIKHMLHGPHTESTPCYDTSTGVCSKKFPKQFRSQTEMNTNGFPNYRRSDNRHEGNTYHGKKNGRIVKVDNSMVVPYNPYLLMKYDCHINVEYCASVMGIKYIHKYIHKGHDRGRFEVTTDAFNGTDLVTDEIQDYVDARYLSASESAWRILELPLHGRSHTVERLPVHLPGMNRVIYTEGNEVQALENQQHTKLTAYFELNKLDTFARSIKYEEVPIHYRWIESSRKWQRRVNNISVISRIVTVSAKEVELFHLKLLLRNIRGATSFDSLKTKCETFHTTFKEAALANGLISSETEMEDVLSEAASCLMPKDLRKYFVYMMIGCCEIDAASLWNKFKGQLSEDTTEQIALISIYRMLYEENIDPSRYCLPEANVVDDSLIINDGCKLEHHQRLFQSMFQQLNEKQMEAFQLIRASIYTSRTTNCFYIDGPAGSGKTFLYECLIHFAASVGIRILTIAWTGIAAILLPFGKTAHKSFHLPLNADDVSTLYWNEKTKRLMTEAKLFIWDEASMIPSAALESIDLSLQDLCRCTEPFGGKIFLLGGDFRQILPVVKKAGKSQVLQSTLKNSKLWPKFKCIALLENMRNATNDSGFSNWLLSIGNGDIEEIVIPESMTSVDLVSDMYSNLSDRDMLYQQAILAPRNEDVSKINNRILSLMPGDLVVSEGIDTVCERGSDATDNCTEFMYPLDYINSLTPSGFPPQKLHLKNGAVVMLIRNLSVSDGLCNGTRLIVKNIRERVLCCEILTGDQAGSIVYIPKIKLDSTADYELPFVLYRTQFPVRLSFAMTINKSQGQSFDRIGLYLTEDHPIFSHGQLYVAFSRCRRLSGIKVQVAQMESNIKVRNVVYKEIFQ